MSGRLVEIIFGPYDSDEGVWLLGLVEYPDGTTFEEELHYYNREECYEDIGDLMQDGYVDLEEDELEEDEDYG